MKLSYLRPFAHIVAATMLVLLGCKQLGLNILGSSSIPSVLGVSVLLSILSWSLYIVLATVRDIFWSPKDVGMLVYTALSTISGAFAIWLLTFAFPGSTSLTGPLAAGPYALVATLLVWGLAYATGSMKPGQTLLPQY